MMTQEQLSVTTEHSKYYAFKLNYIEIKWGGDVRVSFSLHSSEVLLNKY